MIYGFTYDLHAEQFQHSKNVKDLEPTPLLQVNRQIRFEATPQFDKWMRIRGPDLNQAACRYMEECKVTREEDDDSDHEAWIQHCRMRLASARACMQTVKCTLIVNARCTTRAGGLTEELFKTLVESLDDLNKEIEGLDAKLEEIAHLVEALRP